MKPVQPILVVEDEPLIRFDIVDTLQAGGYTVSERGDGASAMAWIDGTTELHGLVTDVNLGDGPTGWMVARHAREKFPRLALVYISGDSIADWAAEGVPNSVVIQKPFAGAQLLTAIANLLLDAGPQPAPEDLGKG